MHLEKFDLNLLVALDALLTEKHVTRAAEKLHVTQPAMSGALARLRSYFDDQLLIKVGSGMELTPRAKELVGEVRDLIFKIRQTFRTFRDFDPATHERDIRIIMSDYAAMVFLPLLTKSLLKSAPKIRCLVEPLSTDTLTRIEHGIADFCLTVEQRELIEDGPFVASLSSDLLFVDEFVVLGSPSSASFMTALTPDSFLSLPYVEVRFAHTLFSVIDRALRRTGMTLRSAAVVPSFTQAAALIAGTDMVTILPRRLAELIAPALGLAVKAAPFTLPQIRETLVWHNRNDADPSHKWFRSELHTVAKQLNSQGPFTVNAA